MLFDVCAAIACMKKIRPVLQRKIDIEELPDVGQTICQTHSIRFWPASLCMSCSLHTWHWSPTYDACLPDYIRQYACKESIYLIMAVGSQRLELVIRRISENDILISTLKEAKQTDNTLDVHHTSCLHLGRIMVLELAILRKMRLFQ